jgi:tripartite-type tricarboxylate transporter receptor subunit TctC
MQVCGSLGHYSIFNFEVVAIPIRISNTGLLSYDARAFTKGALPVFAKDWRATMSGQIANRTEIRQGCTMSGAVLAAKRVCGTVGRVVMTAGLLLGLAASAPAIAQPADFVRGKTINLIVGSGEGGGFDLSARLSAPFLGRHIPGNPTIVVQNMPGASGLRAAEYIYNLAPRDGTAIAITQPSMVQHKVLNASARFDPREFTWIGRLGGFVTYAVVWHAAPAQTIEDAKRRELILGAIGPSGPGAMLPAALNALAGTKITIVKGYKSAAELGLAVERGEVHGSGSASYEYLSSKGWLEKKLARFLFTIGLERSAKAPDSPTVVELVPDGRARNIMKLAASASEIGRSIIAPPGLGAERADILRQAFERMVRDPDFIAESARRALDVEPLPANSLLKIVADDMAMSTDVVDGLRAIMELEK